MFNVGRETGRQANSQTDRQRGRQTDRQTDMTKLIVACRNVANTPENEMKKNREKRRHDWQKEEEKIGRKGNYRDKRKISVWMS